MLKVNVQKNPAALEDLLMGVGTVTQTRGGQEVEVTKINAANMPYDGMMSLADKVTELNDQLAILAENRDLLMAALEVVTLLNALQVNINELAGWLANGNPISAFIPLIKHVDTDQYLGDNLNYVTLEETTYAEDITIHFGSNTDLYVLKGEEFVP